MRRLSLGLGTIGLAMLEPFWLVLMGMSVGGESTVTVYLYFSVLVLGSIGRIDSLLPYPSGIIERVYLLPK